MKIIYIDDIFVPINSWRI